MPLSKVTDIDQILDIVPSGKRMLGLDIGRKTIGIAISNSELTLATPIKTIRRNRLASDAQELEQMTKARQVGGLVVGLPINMDGSEGARCQAVRQFVRNIEHILKLPIIFWDERLSTVAVEKNMISLGVTRLRRKKLLDKEAASFILQGALDYLKNKRHTD